MSAISPGELSDTARARQLLGSGEAQGWRGVIEWTTKQGPQAPDDDMPGRAATCRSSVGTTKVGPAPHSPSQECP